MADRKRTVMDIALIGRIDLTNTLVDGQTVKTRTLYRALREYTNYNVHLVETKNYRQRPLSVAWQLIKAISKSDDVILIVARNGRRVFFPLMYVIAKLLRKRIYHDCIGGRLAEEVREFPRWKKYLNSFRANWMESELLVSNLRAEGIDNAIYLPNFKFFDTPTDRCIPKVPPYRFCTFSRVIKVKGISDAIHAMKELNRQDDTHHYFLDIYGPIDDDYKDEFDRLLVECKDYVSYKGIADPDKGAKIVGEYYALLFPTRYLGEGFPGTILDALFAGVPVIASRWAYYSQMLHDNVTGFSYPFDNPDQLKCAILKLVSLNREAYVELCDNCKKAAEQYSAKEVVAEIVNQLRIGCK